MVAIIDYGMGNIGSVHKALNFLKIDNTITNEADIIQKATAIILPGVGSFAQGMQNLRDRGLVDLLTNEVINKQKKFLGICLGMQLIMKTGFEPYECKGLGWLNGEVVKFQLDNLAIPHMGWNNVNVIKNDYFKGSDHKDFYFIHSYHVVPNDKSIVAATTSYGIDFVSSIQHGNIFATQFHPEKSQVAGLSLLSSFFS